MKKPSPSGPESPLRDSGFHWLRPKLKARRPLNMEEGIGGVQSFGGTPPRWHHRGTRWFGLKERRVSIPPYR